jgi:hypothetical protein
MTAERRSDSPTCDFPKSAAIYMDIIAARERVAPRNRRQLVSKDGWPRVWVLSCSLVKNIDWLASFCGGKFGVNMKDVLDDFGMKDDVPGPLGN